MCFDKYEPLMIGSHVQAMPMGTAGRGMDDRGREHETLGPTIRAVTGMGGGCVQGILLCMRTGRGNVLLASG